MRFEAIFVSFLASAAMASPQGAQRVRRGGGGDGSTVTVTSTVTETTTTTSTVTAEPTCPSDGGGDGSTYAACAGALYGNAQCCSVDVLGVADLDCDDPSTVPTSATDFTSTCAVVGKQAACCVVPLLGQAVLCTPPVGA